MSSNFLTYSLSQNQDNDKNKNQEKDKKINQDNQQNHVSAEILFQALIKKWNDPVQRAIILDNFKKEMSIIANSMKTANFKELLKVFKDKDKRSQILKQLQASDYLPKAKSIFLSPYLLLQVRIAPDGSKIIKNIQDSEIFTPATFKEITDVIKQNINNNPTTTDKAEMFLIQLEKKLTDPKSLQEILNKISQEIDNLILQLNGKLFDTIDSFFKDESKKSEVISILQKYPVLQLADCLVIDPALTMQFLFCYEI